MTKTEKTKRFTCEQLCAIMEPYLDKFCESIAVNWMPPEDYARLEEIVDECIATGKPYDNYMPYPDDENVMVDY